MTWSPREVEVQYSDGGTLEPRRRAVLATRAPDGALTGERLEFYFRPGDPLAIDEVRIRLDHISPALLQRQPWARWVTLAEAAARNEGYAGPALRKVIDEQDGRPRRPGRPGHGREHYQRVASRYVQLLKEGNRKPVQTMAAEMDYSRDTVAGWVRRARQLGLLPPARRSKAG